MKASDLKKEFARKELLKILVAISVLMLGCAIYYFYIRKDALRSAERRAEFTLKNTERIILVHLGRIEATVNAIQPMVEYALDDPDAMFDIARNTVESDPHIMGAGIAFKAYYFPEKGYWYETYAGRQKNCDTLISKQLGSKEHNYFQMDWFQKGMASSKGFWSDPYYDNAGGKARLISYCLPVRDSTNNVVGVICTDVTLDTLASIIKNIKIYPNSYCTLTTHDGKLLVGPPASAKHKGKFHIYPKVIKSKNLIVTLTISDADMYKRLRESTLFFSLMAITGILSIVFISYRSMQNLWQLNEVRMKEQHIEDELAIARNIQQSLLPSEKSSTTINTLDIKGLQIPAKFVGGDLYDYYVRDNKLLFCIGDVSGKGVPAALLMAIAHSLFRTLSAHDDRPEVIMQALNASISDNNPDLMFITMFLGIMDLSTGIVRYCNAGHNPPIIIKDDRAEYLDTEPSLLMGVDVNAEYTANELALSPGDTIFLYTDGLTEAENPQKELFGEQRALKTASQFGTLAAEEQIEQMRQAVHVFVDQAEQSDDLTLLAIRYNPVADFTLTLTNNIDELSRLEPFLENFFVQNDLDSALLSKVDLALEEALANVIMYAYPEGEKGEVTLTSNVAANAICMEIRDKGKPFNPLEQKEADLDVPLKERQIGGLGIHLIKEITDEVRYAYEDGENVLRLTVVVSKTQ